MHTHACGSVIVICICYNLVMRSKDVCICVCMFNNVSVLLFCNFPSRVHLDIPQVSEKDE